MNMLVHGQVLAVPIMARMLSWTSPRITVNSALVKTQRWRLQMFLRMAFPVLTLTCQLVHAEEMTQQCVNNMNDRTGAMTAQDWPALASLAQQYITRCEAAGIRSVGQAYGQRAGAQANMGQYKTALATAETCIRVTYADTSCHVYRAMALKFLNRPKEASVELDRVDRLLVAQMKEVKKAILSAATNEDRELEESRMVLLRANSDFAQALRESL